MPPSLEDFLSDNGSSLLSMATSLTGSRPAGQDLLQDALVQCYPKWNAIAEGAHLAYVRKALVNRSISTWRRKRWSEGPLDDLDELPAQDDWGAAIDDSRLLLGALGRLPTNQRVAVTLRYVQELPLEEVAELMKAPQGTVKSWCSRGLASLRQDQELVGTRLGGDDDE